MRRDSSETKRKILTVCVRLFLEQGYKNTSVSQIVDEAGVARGSYQNICWEVHVETLRQRGIPVVRRISGGGTIYCINKNPPS